MALISQVIEYEGGNDILIWKHPEQNFNSLTQLIVHETQEAIFFKDGQALDLFGPGRYTLETQNVPVIGKLLNLPTNGKTSFQCEIYFINKVEQMAIKWGTDSKVQYMEPTFNFPIQIGASGEMTLNAADSRRLLLKLVGTGESFGREEIVNYFRAFLMTKIKANLVKSIDEKKINIFEIDQYLSDLSEDLHLRLNPDFEEYGIALRHFFVTTILKPDGEATYEKFKELYFRQYADITEAKIRQQVGIIDQQTEAQKLVIESQALAQKRAQEGYSYQQERGFDVAEQVAANEAVGEFTNMGVGLGTMAGVGGAVGGVVGGAVGNVFNDTLNAPTTSCVACGTVIPSGAKFCPSCGEHANDNACPKCGKSVVNNAKFCMHCGQQL